MDAAELGGGGEDEAGSADGRDKKRPLWAEEFDLSELIPWAMEP